MPRLHSGGLRMSRLKPEATVGTTRTSGVHDQGILVTGGGRDCEKKEQREGVYS